MNDKMFFISDGKIKVNANLYDVLIALMIITSLAFYDVKLVFIGLQLTAFAYAFVLAIYRGVRNYTLGYIFWLGLFCACGLISMLWVSKSNTTAFSVTLSVIQVGLVCYCILDYCTDMLHLKRAIKAFLAACILLCIRFVISVPISMWGQGDRLSKETIFGSNTPALVLAYGAIICLWMLLEQKYEHTKMNRFILFFGIVAFMFVSMMVGTRKGIIAFLVAFVVLMIMGAKKPTDVLVKMILIAVFVAGVYIAMMKIPLLYGSIGYRIESMIAGITGGEADSSAVGRSSMLKDAWNVFLEHPIIGVGQDGYRYLNTYLFTYSHNNYVELLANLGIIGFCCFYGLYVWIFTSCRKLGRSGILPMCFLIVLLVLDWGAVGYTVESTYVLLGIILSAVHCMEKEVKINA